VSIVIRKVFVTSEQNHTAAGESDEGGMLHKVTACAVIPNPFSGRGYVEDLSELVEASGPIGTRLGERASEILGEPVQSYGKAAIVGFSGEQEHGNACLTSVFGDAFRAAIGGGKAWISSVTKVGAPGAPIDIPLAFKDEIWVRSHYDACVVSVPEAPLPDEIAIFVAVANRGRINARLGGMTLAKALGSS
jgi:hypothetical protein